MNNELLNELFKLFLSDLIYIRSFISENFGEDKILLNKNQGKFLSRDYSIKNSRIKGYAFHGYGCLFQFKDSYVDIDLRFEKIGFTVESLSKYLEQKGKELDTDKIQEFLKAEVRFRSLEFKEEGIYLLV